MLFPWFFLLVHTTDEDLKFRFFASQMSFHMAQNIMSTRSTINLFGLKYLLIEKNLDHLSKANEKRIIVMVVGHFGAHAHP